MYIKNDNRKQHQKEHSVHALKTVKEKSITLLSPGKIWRKFGFLSFCWQLNLKYFFHIYFFFIYRKRFYIKCTNLYFNYFQ